MHSIEEMRGANKIVETCAAVKEGESVLIVSDWRLTETAERLATAAELLDADVSMVLMEPREHNGNEPPSTVAAAMKQADVVLQVVHRGIGHTSASADALDHGARILGMAKLTPDQLLADGLFVDFEEERPKCQEMARRFAEADEAHVTSENGTDVTFGLHGRQANAHFSMADQPGTFSTVYNIEANLAPAEGTTNGRMVFDGAIPNLDIGLLTNDVVMDVEDGRVTHIEGGWEAEKIARVWEEYDHPAVYNIAQLAVGMNPECREFSGYFVHDHGVYGNVHVGIGTSANLGGETRAPVHFDAMMGDATLSLDGDVVLEKGEFTIF